MIANTYWSHGALRRQQGVLVISKYKDLDIIHRAWGNKLIISRSRICLVSIWFGRQHTWLSRYRSIGKWVHSTGLTGELGRLFTYTAMQLINQVSINPRIRIYQPIKLELLGLIDWLIASLQVLITFSNIYIPDIELLMSHACSENPTEESSTSRKNHLP
jgi:hypothetical protein